MADTILGYNIVIKILVDDGADGITEKKFLGITSNTFGIEPKTKESITKDDEGFTRTRVTGYNYNFGAEGLIMVKEDGGPDEEMDRDDIMDQVIEGTEFEFIYGPKSEGAKNRKGKAVITNFQESTNSEDEGTFTLSARGTSKLEKVELPVE